MSVTPERRAYPVVYGGWIGGLLALLILVAVLVLWINKSLDNQGAALFGGLALAILLR